MMEVAQAAGPCGVADRPARIAHTNRMIAGPPPYRPGGPLIPHDTVSQLCRGTAALSPPDPRAMYRRARWSRAHRGVGRSSRRSARSTADPVQLTTQRHSRLRTSASGVFGQGSMNRSKATGYFTRPRTDGV